MIIFFFLNDCEKTAEKLPLLDMHETNYFNLFVLFLFSNALSTRTCCVFYQSDFLQISMIMSAQYSGFANGVHQQGNTGSMASMINYNSDQYQYDSLHKRSHIATVVSLFCKAFTVCYGPGLDDNLHR